MERGCPKENGGADERKAPCKAVSSSGFRTDRIKSFKDPFWQEWKGRSKATKPENNV